MAYEGQLLINATLSMNPCPICVDAGQQPAMSLDDWMVSDWGIPGSSTRFCEDDCHCALIPEAVVEEFPTIDERVRLRGEEGSEIRAIIDIGPSEQGLKEIMDKWNEDVGKLPPKIYTMPLLEVEPFLRELYAEWLIEGRG